MDRNLLLAFVLSFAVLTGWMILTGPAPSPPGSEPGLEQPEEPLGFAESQQARRDPLPPSSQTLQTPQGLVSVEREAAVAEPKRLIEIERPLYTTTLSSRGAGMTSWKLKEFRETSDPTSPQIELITARAPHQTAFVTPFHELEIGDLSTQDFEVVSENFDHVVFQYAARGITVRKTFSFDTDGYAFNILLEIDNQTASSISPRFQTNIAAHVRDGSDFSEISISTLKDGSVKVDPLRGLGQGGFFKSLTGGKAERYTEYVGGVDWTGVQTTYFLAAVVADIPKYASVRLEATVPGEAAVAALFFDATEIPPGTSYEREFRAYMGPKEIDRLEAFGSETARAIDLGWSWVQPLTRFFAQFLTVLYSIIPNYGVAIIILTILVRVVTAPLTIKQMRSMERMRMLSPKLKEIQAKYADDRKKQSEQTMALYKSEGVNPLGGCLPMLLQFPVFIGLFYALRSTISLRQSPFFGWIDDLSAPETLFEIPGIGIPVRVLPLAMGASMVLQQKITPMQMDPAQAKMMMTIMPVMMTFVFYQFPSGLVLYWMVSNVLAISHQLYLGRGMRGKTAAS